MWERKIGEENPWIHLQRTLLISSCCALIKTVFICYIFAVCQSDGDSWSCHSSLCSSCCSSCTPNLDIFCLKIKRYMGQFSNILTSLEILLLHFWLSCWFLSLQSHSLQERLWILLLGKNILMSFKIQSKKQQNEEPNEVFLWKPLTPNFPHNYSLRFEETVFLHLTESVFSINQKRENTSHGVE